MTRELEDAVLLKHGAQAAARVLRLKQPEWGTTAATPFVEWFWLALKLPGQPEQLLGRRRTEAELVAMVEKPRYQTASEKSGQTAENAMLASNASTR